MCLGLRYFLAARIGEEIGGVRTLVDIERFYDSGGDADIILLLYVDVHPTPFGIYKPILRVSYTVYDFILFIILRLLCRFLY